MRCRQVDGGLSGKMVDLFGYSHFFIATAMIGAPVVVLTLLVWRWQPRRPQKPDAKPQATSAIVSERRLGADFGIVTSTTVPRHLRRHAQCAAVQLDKRLGDGEA